TLRSNLRERARNRVAAEINEFNEELQRISRELCKGGTSHGPVTIHAADIHAKISQQGMDFFHAMSINDIAAEHGDEFLLALVTQTADAGRKQAYMEYYNERRKKQHEDEIARRDARDDFAAFVDRNFGDDPKTRQRLLTDPAFLDSVKNAFL